MRMNLIFGTAGLMVLAACSVASVPGRDARGGNIAITAGQSHTGVGQQAGRPVPGENSDRGREVLERALAALGGAERIRAIATWDIEGSGRENLTAEAQGMAPNRPVWRDHRERVAVDARTLTVAWFQKTPRNDHSVRWRRLIYGPERTGFIDFTAGRGVLRPPGTPESERRAQARRVPHLLLLEAATAQSVTWRGERQLNGEPVDVVDASLSDDARLKFFLSRTPAVLRRVEYQTYLPTRGDVTVGWEWEGWRSDEAVGLVPTAHRIEITGATFREVTYSRFSVNTEVGDLFNVPELEDAAAAAPAPPAAGFEMTGEVAPGVHVGNIDGYRVMLVEFDEFVIAVEAPEAYVRFDRIPATRPAQNVNRHQMDWIREVAGGKPIRYLVVSHHHSDHMGGIRAFAAAGATLLVSPGEVEAARHALSAPHTIAADGWSGLASSARIKSVADRYVVGTGGHRVEVLNVGPNPHTNENLIVWLPNDGIIFQGDLFYYTEGAPFPPPNWVTMNTFFACWLDSHGIKPAAVYGVHNRGVAGPAALARAGGGCK